MATQNLNLSRLGQRNKRGGSYAADNALFLKVFSGEVLTAFKENNIMEKLHRIRSIPSGKSAQFPVIGKGSARYHTPGTPVLGNAAIEHNDVTINIDDLLIADVTVYDLDDAKNHYDVRQEYSFQMGAALAKEFDQNCLQVACLAARASGNTPSSPGGTQVTAAKCKTDGEILAGALFDAAQRLDENDVPEEDRVCVVRPAQWYLLAQTTKVLNRDWGGKGSYSDGTVVNVAGIKIVKSNNLPSAKISAATRGERNTYYGDFSKTAAVVFSREAVGTVKLKELSTQMTSGDFQIMYQADLIVAKYAVGHGILRPECAVEIVTP